MLTKYRGVILGLAYADALGAGYEFFKGKIGEDEVIDFIEIPKITVHKKYEWSDDTAMTYLTLKAINPRNTNQEFVDYELLSYNLLKFREINEAYEAIQNAKK